MDIGIKRIIDVGKAKKKLGKYLPEGEVIEDDQQLLELFEIYNRVGRNCLDELKERTKESFLQILAKEIDEELSKLLPKKPKSFSWKS
ncbi:MAG TPA: hypothetical protein EYP29_04950, partial [Thermoplasmata archaeon]|nr:hypothetical protein [Thermoplasmata archaeon]